MRMVALIVTFFPEKELLQQNINSFIDHVDQLLVWDNTPESGHLEQPVFSFLKQPKIKLLGDGQNHGIGYALNQGIKYAIEQRFTHILTLDQDSRFSGETFRFLSQAIEIANDPLVAGIAPYTYIQDLTSAPKKAEKEITKTDNVITSGTLYATAILKKIGAFRDDFFIDAIDTEYNLRAKKSGFYFLQVPNALLLHQLGSIEIKSLGFRSVRCFNYPPLRCYYFARNHYHVCCSYPSAKRWFAYWKSFFFRNFSIALFETNKRKKISAYIHGLFDGMRHKTGICKRYHP